MGGFGIAVGRRMGKTSSQIDGLKSNMRVLILDAETSALRCSNNSGAKHGEIGICPEFGNEAILPGNCPCSSFEPLTG